MATWTRPLESSPYTGHSPTRPTYYELSKPDFNHDHVMLISTKITLSPYYTNFNRNYIQVNTKPISISFPLDAFIFMFFLL